MDEVATMSRVIEMTKQVVDGIEPSQLDNPSPCAAWTVRDVLNHIAGGAQMFAICVRDGAIPDEQLGQIIGGDNLGDDYKASFRAAADAAEASFQIPGAMERVVKLPFGEMPASIALNIAVFDLSTHAWDLAKATGQSTTLDPEVVEIAYGVAQVMLTDEMRASGLFGPEVPVDDSAPVADRLAALAGRTP